MKRFSLAAAPSFLSIVVICLLASCCVLVVTARASAASKGINNFWGNPTSAASVTGGEFSLTPGGIAINSAGNGAGAVAGDIYVVDRGNNRVEQFRAEGAFVRAFGVNVGGAGVNVCTVPASCAAGTASSAAGGMSAPQGIAINQATGNLFVTDQGNRRIDVFGADGTFQGAFGWGVDTGAAAFEFCTTLSACQAPAAAGGAGGQFGIAIGYPAVAPAGAPDAGNLLVADSTNNRLDEFSFTLNLSNEVTAAAFVRGIGWDVDSSGGSGQLEVCTTSCKAGAAGGGVGQFTVAGATRVAVDATGAIYAVNLPTAANCNAPGNHCHVQKFAPSGLVAEEFAPAQLNFITGNKANQAATDVAVDSGSGDVYVARPTSLSATDFKYEILRFSSSGALLESYLTGVGIEKSTIFGLAYNGVSGRAVFTSTFQKPRVFSIEESPASFLSTLSATVGTTTGITTQAATLHGVAIPAADVSRANVDTLYRFEYGTNKSGWIKAPAVSAELGNGSGAPAPDSCPAGNPPSCNVTQNVTGLEPSAVYQVRLVAETRFGGTVSVSPVDSFETAPTAPTVIAREAWWSSPVSTGPSLLLNAELNPENSPTTYYFQYVDQAHYDAGAADPYAAGGVAPAAPADAGSASKTLLAQQAVTGLDPTTAYHFRLVAENADGLRTAGADGVVGPPESSQRFYELVSVGDHQGTGVNQLSFIADDGDSAIFNAQAFAEPSSLPEASTPFFAERGAAGWAVSAAGPAPDNVGGRLVESSSAPDSDLSRMLWVKSPLGGRARGEMQWEFAWPDGSRAPASPLLAPLAFQGTGIGVPGQAFGAAEGEPALYGSSASLSHAIFSVPRSKNGVGGTSAIYVPGENFVDPKPNDSSISNLYELSQEEGGGSSLRLVNVSSEGTQLGGGCGAQLGGMTGTNTGFAARAVSLDGAVIHFTARPGEAPEGELSCTKVSGARVFKRIDHATTVQISQAQCAPTPACPGSPSGDDLYRGASTDGSIAFFTTPRRLTNSDTDSTADLYAYDDQVRNEVQKLVVSATSGSYKLSFGAGGPGVSETASIAWNAPAEGSGSVRAALQAIANVGAGGVSVSGGPGDAGGTAPYLIEFSGPAFAGKPQPPVSVVAGTLTGTAKVEPLVSGGHLTQVSAGQSVAGHATVGSGAEVLGVVDSAADGSRAYFVAKGALVAGAAPGANNLYAYDRDGSDSAGAVRFVGALASSDSTLWSHTNSATPALAIPLRSAGGEQAGDGHFLFVRSTAVLTAEDLDAQPDLYRYDDTAPLATRLRCLSCAGQGAFPIEPPGGGQRQELGLAARVIGSRMASEDGGSVVFATSEALLPVDANAAPDVYLWRDGALSLISAGAGKVGADSGGFGISAQGADVFFVTTAPLAAGDSASTKDVYDARVAGGFPAAPSRPSCLDDEGCHGAVPAPPGAPPVASVDFAGPGNQVPALPKGCGRGKVKRNGKCVKKPRQKKHKAAKNSRRSVT